MLLGAVVWLVLTVLDPPGVLVVVLIVLAVVAALAWPFTMSATGTLAKLQFEIPRVEEVDPVEIAALRAELDALVDTQPIEQLDALLSKASEPDQRAEAAPRRGRADLRPLPVDLTAGLQLCARQPPRGRGRLREHQHDRRDLHRSSPRRTRRRRQRRRSRPLASARRSSDDATCARRSDDVSPSSSPRTSRRSLRSTARPPHWPTCRSARNPRTSTRRWPHSRNWPTERPSTPEPTHERPTS